MHSVQVMKKPGMIIEPIKFEDVNPFERVDDHKRNGQKQKQRINRGQGRAKAVVTKS